MEQPIGRHAATHPVSSLGLAEADRYHRSVAVGIVTDVLAMLPDLPGHKGQAARSAAYLLLEHTCPWLDQPSRDELALMCERAAARFRTV